MADVSKRLAGPALLSAAAATIYTVPALTTGQVVHIHVYNNDTVTRDFTMSIGADAAGTRIYDAYPIPPKDFVDDDGLYVLAAAEIIQAFASSANKLTVTISGVEST